MDISTDQVTSSGPYSSSSIHLNQQNVGIGAVPDPNKTPPRMSDEISNIEIPSPSTPRTPAYKKYRSIEGRKSTPRKIITPRKKSFARFTTNLRG